MVAADATVILWLPLASVSTVTETPLTAMTSPLTNVPFGRGVALGFAVGLGRGLAPGAGLGAKLRAAQPVAVFGEMFTMVAVTTPDESFTPLATMHVPAAMSARVASEDLVNVVLVV
jgi:hypothetical protein